MATLRSHLSALAKLNDKLVGSKEKKFRKIPHLKQELAFNCLCLLAACGQSFPLKRGGDVAELAAAVFEWATGQPTIVNHFASQINALRKDRLLDGDKVWDEQVRRRADAMVRGDWPGYIQVQFVPSSPSRTR